MALLLIANVCLLAHVFLLNDWSGLTTDFADSHKAASVLTTRGLGARKIGGPAAGLLAASLVLLEGSA